jgi:Mg2+-importing ATPase
MSDRPSLDAAASMQATEVLTALGTSDTGLTSAEAEERLAAEGPNAVRTHHASLWRTLIGQFRSPLLLLLLAAALVSAIVGEGADALIIGVIVTASVGLGTANEFRADKAAEALHSQIRHEVSTLRDGKAVEVEATQLVPGDVVSLGIGAIVPADLRIVSEKDIECDESILTGESLPVEKTRPHRQPRRMDPPQPCSWERSSTAAPPRRWWSRPARTPGSARSHSASVSATRRRSSRSGSRSSRRSWRRSPAH